MRWKIYSCATLDEFTSFNNMQYYINTEEQIKGAEAYRERDLGKALFYYKRGLHTLNKIAEQQHYTPDRHFNNGLVSALSDIIFTKIAIINLHINSSFDLEPIDTMWEEIPDIFSKLETIYKNTHSDIQSEITLKKITLVYIALADICEQLSDDRLFLATNERDIQSAIQWLNQSINFSDAANLPVKVSIHMKHLRLLEEGYKSSQNKQFLFNLNESIKKNVLFSLELSSMQELEILSYQLLVAVENKEPDKAISLVKKCKKIMTERDDIDYKSILIDNIEKLVTKLSKQRKVIFAIPGDKEIKQEQETLVFDSGKNPKHLSPPFQSTSMLLSSMTHQMKFFRSSLKMSQSLTASTAPPTLPRQQSTEAFTWPQKNYIQSFIDVMHKIAERYQDNKLLANLLSLIADFYQSGTLPFSIKKRACILAYELYQAVLLIDKVHEDACDQLANLFMQNQQLFFINHQATKNMGYPKIQESFIGTFNQAIEDNMIQLETFLCEDTAQLETSLNNLLQFVSLNIIEKKIAGSRSQLMASQIVNYYKELLDLQVVNWLTSYM